MNAIIRKYNTDESGLAGSAFLGSVLSYISVFRVNLYKFKIQNDIKIESLCSFFFWAAAVVNMLIRLFI